MDRKRELGNSVVFALRDCVRAEHRHCGQGAELQVGNVFTNAAFDSSELMEYGIKGRLLDDRLYFALSTYEMERTDFNAQSITVNQAVKTEGTSSNCAGL